MGMPSFVTIPVRINVIMKRNDCKVSSVVSLCEKRCGPTKGLNVVVGHQVNIPPLLHNADYSQT